MTKPENNIPPRWADQFLEWYCAPAFIEEIQGDLHEAFHRRCAERGLATARLLFVYEVLRSLSFRTFDKSIILSVNSNAMFTNYLKSHAQEPSPAQGIFSRQHPRPGHQYVGKFTHPCIRPL